MINLLTAWQELVASDCNDHEVLTFKQTLELYVGVHYSWLVSELFGIEGELGWGPGFREYDGDEFFPPRTDYASSHMETFLNTLSNCRPDRSLLDSLMAAIDRTGSHDNLTFMLQKFLDRLTEKNAESLVLSIYGLISKKRSAYVLGGARIYRSILLEQGDFLIALAGLLNIYYRPLNFIQVKAMTVHHYDKYTVNKFKESNYVDIKLECQELNTVVVAC